MTRRRCSEEAEEKESVKARQAELSTPGSVRRVVLSILDWRLRAGDTLLHGWRLSPRLKRRSAFPRCRLLLMGCRAAIPWWRSGLDLRRNFRRPLRRLSSEHKRRRHVGRRCRGGDAALVRDEKIAVTRDLGHTGAVADDHCNHQTYYCKKNESWHRNIQTVHAPTGS